MNSTCEAIELRAILKMMGEYTRGTVSEAELIGFTNTLESHNKQYVSAIHRNVANYNLIKQGGK